MDCFNWNAVSAVGTVLAAIVGIVGIWINIYEKRRKLYVTFDNIFRDKIYLCNNSVKSVKIIKVVGIVDNHVFYVGLFEGLSEIVLHPSEMRTLSIDKEDLYKSYFSYQMDALCNQKDPIDLVVYDNYRRKYRIKTGVGIAFFKD